MDVSLLLDDLDYPRLPWLIKPFPKHHSHNARRAEDIQLIVFCCAGVVVEMALAGLRGGGCAF